MKSHFFYFSSLFLILNSIRHNLIFKPTVDIAYSSKFRWHNDGCNYIFHTTSISAKLLDTNINRAQSFKITLNKWLYCHEFLYLIGPQPKVRLKATRSSTISYFKSQTVVLFNRFMNNNHLVFSHQSVARQMPNYRSKIRR